MAVVVVLVVVVVMVVVDGEGPGLHQTSDAWPAGVQVPP